MLSPAHQPGLPLAEHKCTAWSRRQCATQCAQRWRGPVEASRCTWANFIHTEKMGTAGKGQMLTRFDASRFIVYFVHIIERHISYAARYLHTAHPGQGMGAQGRLEPPHPLNTTRTSVEHVLHPGSPCKPPWRSAGRERGNLHPFALSHEHRQERSCTGSHPQATSECISEA